MYSHNAYAHAGPHEGDCEITVGEEKFRLSGYQLQSKLPERHYCRVYPALGKLLLQLEFINPKTKYTQIELKLSAASFGDALNANSLFNRVISKKLIPINNAGKILLETEIQEVALHSLEIKLIQADGTYQRNQFMFLVGVPVAKILIGFSVLLLLVLLFTSIKQSYYRQH
jgi:hypothetical protein